MPNGPASRGYQCLLIGVKQTQRGHAATLKGHSMEETVIDQAAMGRLAKVLVFICGKDHPTTVALQLAADTGSERDIKNARALFIKLKPADRRAALAMLNG